MSDTPETDAAMLLEREGITHPELHETYIAWTDYWALGQHARSLERRLQEAHDMCDRYAEQLQAALREVEELREALRAEPGKWGWDLMMLVGRRVLDELYPADIFTRGASGDLGPVYIVTLRKTLAAIDTAALAEKGKP